MGCSQQTRNVLYGVMDLHVVSFIEIEDNTSLVFVLLFPLCTPVKVCNCTELGYCYMAPVERSLSYGMGPTIGILAGTLGFCGKSDKHYVCV